MSTKTRLKNALSALEGARRHVKRAKNNISDDTDTKLNSFNIRRALREIKQAIDEIERAISEVKD